MVWIIGRELTLPSHYRDPCTGQMIPRRMSNPDWFDEQARDRAEFAYRHGESDQRRPLRDCVGLLPPTDPAERALKSAGMREVEARVRTRSQRRPEDPPSGRSSAPPTAPA